MKFRPFLHYGVGDLWESREFVKDWMRALGVSECEYACRYPAVFEDMPEIKTTTVGAEHQMRTGWYRQGEDFFLNLWIGCRNAETRPSGDYVIWPGVGCTVENLYRMHNQYLSEAGLPPLPRSIADYIPTIDYSRIKTDQMWQMLNVLRGKRLVLLCNGATGSGHAANFSFAKMVELLPSTPDTFFIFTERQPVERDGVFFTDDITLRPPGGSDMLAISYLSTFCSVIVGRCSGAQMPCETLSNWRDESKTLLSFTQHDNGATFVRNPAALGLKMKRVWSGADSPESAAQVLAEVLKSTL